MFTIFWYIVTLSLLSLRAYFVHGSPTHFTCLQPLFFGASPPIFDSQSMAKETSSYRRSASNMEAAYFDTVK